MKRIVLLGILVGILTVSAPGMLYGQEDTDAAAVERGKALLERCKEVDPALLGTFWYGIYLKGVQGHKNIGTAKFVVEKAPEGSGGAYLFKIELKVSWGGSTVAQTEDVCDASFALLSRKGTEDEGGGLKSLEAKLTGTRWEAVLTVKTVTHVIHQPDEQFANDEVIIWKDAKRTERAFKLTPGTFVVVLETLDGAEVGSPHKMLKIQTEEGEEGWVPDRWCKEETDTVTGSYGLEGAAKNHWEDSSVWGLVRKVDLTKTGRCLLKGIDWPEPDEDVKKDLDASAVKKVTLQVLPAAGIKLRGQEVQTHRVRVEKEEDDEIFIYHLDANHNILGFELEEQPILIVAGTEEEAKKDIGTPDAAPAEGTPRAAVMVFLKVLAKAEKVEALDGVMDWASIKEEANTDPDIAAMDLESFKAETKKQFAEAPAMIPKEMLQMISGGLQEKIEGDTATVQAPGQPKPISLKKINGKWMIVKLGR
ncbi:MAG: hypothetical protein ACYTHM_18900 [Planctomycetota bacterium]